MATHNQSKRVPRDTTNMAFATNNPWNVLPTQKVQAQKEKTPSNNNNNNNKQQKQQNQQSKQKQQTQQPKQKQQNQQPQQKQQKPQQQQKQKGQNKGQKGGKKSKAVVDTSKGWLALIAIFIALSGILFYALKIKQ